MGQNRTGWDGTPLERTDVEVKIVNLNNYVFLQVFEEDYPQEESMNMETSNRRSLDVPGPSFSTLINGSRKQRQGYIY